MRISDWSSDVCSSDLLGQVTVNFAEGQDRAQASGSAQSRVIRSAAVLPADIQEKITRERRPGDEDAAIDPMTEPGVRDAVRNASFAVLVGFQLDQAQLASNPTNSARKTRCPPPTRLSRAGDSGWECRSPKV